MSKKEAEVLTDEQLLRELFSDEVVEKAKEEIGKAEKRGLTPKKKPQKSTDRE